MGRPHSLGLRVPHDGNLVSQTASRKGCPTWVLHSLGSAPSGGRGFLTGVLLAASGARDGLRVGDGRTVEPPVEEAVQLRLVPATDARPAQVTDRRAARQSVLARRPGRGHERVVDPHATRAAGASDRRQAESIEWRAGAECRVARSRPLGRGASGGCFGRVPGVAAGVGSRVTCSASPPGARVRQAREP